MSDDFAYLTGPNLVDRANEIIQGLNGEKLSSLYITKVFGKHAEIHRALTLLRGHFNQNAIIYVSESQEFPAVSNQTIKMIESASGVKVRYGVFGTFPSNNGIGDTLYKGSIDFDFGMRGSNWSKLPGIK